MPWTANDADKHKKGLSEKQRKRWAAVANAVLKRCNQNSEDDCEGKAIKIANARVG